MEKFNKIILKCLIYAISFTSTLFLGMFSCYSLMFSEDKENKKTGFLVAILGVFFIVINTVLYMFSRNSNSYEFQNFVSYTLPHIIEPIAFTATFALDLFWDKIFKNKKQDQTQIEVEVIED